MPYTTIASMRVLSIAGSDPSGGAGIQADLKTFSALGCYGMAVVTALTAQNTLGVFGVQGVEAEFVGRQIDCVLEDIGADAVKTGMLLSAEIIVAVADALARRGFGPQAKGGASCLVVDPVMVATSGAVLLGEDARGALVSRLLPMALVVTPNVPEAEVLSVMRIASADDMRAAGERIHTLGPRYVLMKGGHLPGADAVDYLYDGTAWVEFRAERVATKNTHGTGCTLSAAIAAELAKGADVVEAVGNAKEYLTGALRATMQIGKGRGPVNHLWREQRNA